MDETRQMPTRRDYFGVGVVNDRIYIVGGRGWPQVGNPGGTFLTVMEEYTPETNQWRKKNDILDLRLYSSTVVVGDQIYLIGGFVWRDGLRKDPAAVDVYTPATDEWSDIPPMPTGKTPFGVAIVKGKIYVFGGEGENGEFLPTVEVFDTSFHAAIAAGKLPTRWRELKTQRRKNDADQAGSLIFAQNTIKSKNLFTGHQRTSTSHAIPFSRISPHISILPDKPKSPIV